MYGYVVKGESTSLTLKSSTPSNIIPQIGDKLVYADMDDMFPAGFAGKVKRIDSSNDGSYNIVCEPVELEQIFKYYCSTTGNQSGYDTRAVADGTDHFGHFHDNTPRTVSLTDKLSTFISGDLDEETSISHAASLDGSITMTPDIDYRATIIISPNNGTYVSFSGAGKINLKENLAISGKIACEKKIEVKSPSLNIPICPFLTLYFTPGAFARIEGSLNTKFESEQNIKTAFAMSYSSKGDASLKNVWPKFKVIDAQNSMIGSANFTAQLGGKIELGLGILDPKLSKIYLNYELGPKIEADKFISKGDLIDATKSTKLYESLKESSVKGNLCFNVSAGAEAGSGSMHIGSSYDIAEIVLKPLFEHHYVPQFSETTSKREEGKSTNVVTETKISGKCTSDQTVGFAFLDEDGVEYASGLYTKEYKDEDDFGTYSIETRNISSAKDLTVYPTVEIDGYNILGSPSFDLPKSIEFKDVSVSDIKDNSVVVTGRVLGYDKEAETGNVYIKYSSGMMPTENGQQTSKIEFADIENGMFCIPVGNLDSKTRYYISPVAEIGKDKVDGEVKNIITIGKGMSEDALVSFYKSTKGEEWTKNTNWCSDNPIQEWFGLNTLNTDNSYFRKGLLINLPNNNVSGYASLKNMNLWHYIDLSGNKLTNVKFEKDSIGAHPKNQGGTVL